MSYIFKFCILIFFFSSCTNIRNSDISVLTHKTIELGGLIMGAPTGIRCLNSYLVILDNQGDSLFHLVDPDKKEYTGSFGVRGNGPKEFLYPYDLNQYNEKALCCYDINRKLLSKIEVKALSTPILVFTPMIRVDSCMHFNVFGAKQNAYIGIGAYMDSKLKVINSDGDILKGCFHYPCKDENEKKLSEAVRAMAYQGPADMNGNNLVHATLYANILSFYTLKDATTLDLIKENCESYPVYKPDEGSKIAAVMDRKSPMGFIDVIATEKNVYALYSGKTFEEYQLKCLESEYIYQYNWQGELIKQFKLDIPVVCFCVDEQEKKIYGIANNPDPQIVEFALSK